MDTQDSAASALSSSQIPLPPLPARGTGAALPSRDDFKRLLATQGIDAPESGTLNDTQARIMAAQIAGKANVNAGVKRQPVVAGMNTAQAPIAAPQRFMPLRQGPGAARTFSASENGSTNTVEALRATSKFAPGPVTTTVQSAPVVAQAIKRAQENGEVQQATTAVSAVKATEAYSFGLRAASQSQAEKAAAGDVPPWFSNAMESAIDKYQAMKTAQ